MGDSRAVKGTIAINADGKEKGWRAEELSKDQKPDDPFEMVLRPMIPGAVWPVGLVSRLSGRQGQWLEGGGALQRPET